jgi:signal transduction histidine kinase
MDRRLEDMTKAELIAELRRRDAIMVSPDSAASLRHELDVHQEELRVQHEQLRHSQSLLESSRNEYAELYDFAPIAYLTLDAQGVIKAINLTGCALLEAERVRLLDLPFVTLVAENQRKLFLDHMRRCRINGDKVTTEVDLKTRGNRIVPVLILSRTDGATAYRTIVMDLTERKGAENEIRELNLTLEDRVRKRTMELEQAIGQLKWEIGQRQVAEDALQEASRRKDEFLAMLGHELRNPLMPIRNAAEVMRFVARESPEIQEMVAIILRQSAHMKRLVDDLLDVSRIMRGKIELHAETLNLTKVVRGVLDDYANQLRSDQIALNAELPEEPIWVYGDETRLSQVLGNLLHNADKFSSRGGQIKVSLRFAVGNGLAELSVCDTGVGIAPEMLPRVFDLFSQSDNSLDRHRGGLGLGLALVKGLVELHGGQVEAASGGVNQGAQFTIRLPVAQHPAELLATSDAPANHRCYRVLIIDDQRDTLLTMKRLLAGLGHEVYTAADGEEGVRVARETRPDVVFSDVGLPGIDGYGVARRLRVDPVTQSSYLVAITGYGQGEDQRRAREAGFDRHLTKPIPFQEIEQVFASLTE